MKNKIRLLIKKLFEWEYINILIIIFFSFFFLFPFLFKYICGDDTGFHLKNIEFYSNISIFSKIVPGYMNNLGWGVGIFYPCLPHILGAIILKFLKIFGFGSILAIKILKLFIVILSGLFMYFLASKIYKDKTKGMLCSLFYLSSSYFFVDTYMRDAINESAVFVFIPLVFLGLYYLFNEQNKFFFYLCFIMGYVGMIYCHLVLTMWFTILLLFFLIFYFKKIFIKDIFISFVISIFIVVGLTGTFIFPLVEHMIVDKWFIPAYKNVWILPFRGYLIPDYYKTISEGLLFINFSHFVIILFFVGLFNIIFMRKKYKYDKNFLVGILLFSVVSVIISSQTWFWNIIPKFFNNIQFSWRLVAFSTFGVCLFAGSGLETIYNFFKDKYRYVFNLFLLVLIFDFTYNNIKLVDFKDDIMNICFYDPNVFSIDYFPNKANNNIDYIKNIDSKKAKVLSGSGNVEIISNDKDIKFRTSNIDKYIEIELPKFYYLGYEIVDKNGNKIKYSESDMGLIKLKVNKNGVYQLKYTGTMLYKISILYKVITIIFMVYVIINKNKFWQVNKYDKKK